MPALLPCPALLRFAAMKRTLLTLAACLGMTAVMAGCGPSKADLEKQAIENSKTAIRQVYAQSGAAAKAATHKSDIEDLGDDFNARQYVGLISKISTSDCPKNFQMAWFDYVRTFESELSGGKIIMNLGKVLDKKMPSLPEVAERDALDKLDRAALEDGVEIHR